jgi:methionyl-tRNA synthetase
MQEKILITATPPTPNGNLHVGHLSGPYIGADVLRRFLKMRKVFVRYISGADDHQSYVPLKGKQLGKTPIEIANDYTAKIEHVLDAAQVKLDLFVKPRSRVPHIPFVQKFFATLYNEGKFITKNAPSLYSEHDDLYLFEAHVSGQCPHCGARCDGNACEQCGRPNDCVDLINPVSKYSQETLGTRNFTRLYFPLKNYEKQLQEYYKSVHMDEHLRSLCEKMLADGLPDIPVSHITDWGIPVPIQGFENQSIAVWVEMAPGYLAATGQLQEDNWQTFWKNEDARVIQFFGFDNGYFHAVLFPALFLAYDPEIRLPEAFITNEFYLLDGKKFSTSRGHAIWADELLNKVSADIVRFYVSYTRPETEQTNFVYTEFQETVQRELIYGWQGWLQELGTKVKTEFAGVAPPAEELTKAQYRLYQELLDFIRAAAYAYDVYSFSPQHATRICCELVRVIRRFARGQNHLRDVDALQKERSTGVGLELLAARILAQIAAPIMPDFSSRLWHNLGYESEIIWEDNPDFVPSRQKIDGLEIPYFHLLN